MAHCSSCSAQVLWVKLLPRGGSAPLDATPTLTGNIRITDNRRSVGKVLTKRELEDARTKGELLYTSHFATCPDAVAHRNKKTALAYVAQKIDEDAAATKKSALPARAASPQPPLSRDEHSGCTAGSADTSNAVTVRP